MIWIHNSNTLIASRIGKAASVIQVFASPTGYMLTSFGFPLLNWGIFYRFL